IHALEHLRTMGAVASTRENLAVAATGEMQEIDVTLPRMIREAEEDGRPDAAASFRLALERDRHHPDIFRHPLPTFDAPSAPSASAAASSPAAPASPPPAAAASASGRAPVAVARAPATATRTAGVTAATMRRMDGRAHMSELDTEPGRIERLASIREVVFGAQD